MTLLTDVTGTQQYFDADGLLRKYGTDKAVPVSGGEFKMYGAVREIEFMLDLSKLTTTAQVLNDQIFFPNGTWIESVQVDVQVAAATFTAMSIGHVGTTRDSTVATDNSFIDAEVAGTFTLGKVILYDASTTHHGTLLGTITTTAAFFPGYLTGKITGSAGTGLLKIRIRYRSGTPTTQ